MVKRGLTDTCQRWEKVMHGSGEYNIRGDESRGDERAWAINNLEI
jgi:hypothetical protein